MGKQKTYKLLFLGIIVVFLFSLFLPLTRLIPLPKASADATSGPYTWIDRLTISDGTGKPVYLDGKIDNNYTYSRVSGSECSTEKDTINTITNGNSKATLTYWTVPDPLNPTHCIKHDLPINLKNPNLSDAYFVWQDKTTISSAGPDNEDGSKTYLYDTTTKTFNLSGDKTCIDSITFDPSNSTVGHLTVRSGTGSGGQVPSTTYDQYHGPNDQPLNFQQASVQGSCYIYKPVAITLGMVANQIKEACSSTACQQGKTDQSGSTGGVEDSCESQSEILGWIMCPVIKLLDEAAGWLDGQIQQLLTTPNPADITGLESAWARIRNITLILVIPIMLVMVISTALGFSFVDAYTIKRAMPRLIIAIIAISVSFYLMSFLVQVTNSVGQGVLGLLTAPFGGPNASLASMVDAAGSVKLTAASGAIFLALVATGVVSFMIILSFAFVTVLALLVGFVVLTLRQLLIIALVVIAPLAILLWIFPSTDRGWKFWWSNYSKLLLMFPLVMALIAVGQDFAFIMSKTNAYSGVDDLLKQLMVIIAYIAPFFFIPATFKMGGTMFGAMAGAVTGATAGLRQGQAKARAGERAKGWQDFKSGQRGPAAFRKAGFATGTFLGASKKRDLFTAAGRREAAAQQRKLNMLAYQQTDRAKAFKDDDGMLRAQTYASQAEAEAHMAEDWGMNAADVSRSIAAARANGGFSAEKANYATRALVATGTGYDNVDQLHKTVARVAGSNRSMAADLLGEANAVTKQVGRHDMAATYQGHMDMYDAIQSRGGYETAAGGGDILTAYEQNAALTRAAKDVDAVTFMRDKPRSVGNMSDALRDSFNVAQANGDTTEAARLAGLIEKIDQSGTYASTTNVETAGERVVTPTEGTVTVNVPGPNGAPIEVPVDGRRAVVSSASTSQVQVNPVTEQVESVMDINPKTGAPFVDPNTGRPLAAPNPTRDARAAEILRRNSPGRQRGPNDPDF